MLGFIVAALALPAPSPIPQQNPASACAPVPGTYAEAFGTQVDDRAALRFVRNLETADPGAQAAAIARTRTGADAAMVAAIEDAAKHIPCSEAVAAILNDRMVAAITTSWKISNDSDAAGVSARIELVAEALAARALLPTKMVDEVVAPFATTLDVLVAPAPTLPTPCATAGATAHTVRLSRPRYPAMARLNLVAGKVLVKVDLDAEGNVTRASLFSDDLPDRPGAAQVREAAISAAATTVYEPAIQLCEAVAGSYIFRAQFRR